MHALSALRQCGAAQTAIAAVCRPCFLTSNLHWVMIPKRLFFLLLLFLTGFPCKVFFSENEISNVTVSSNQAYL